MAGVTGDFKGLRELQRRARSLGGPVFQRKAAVALGQESLALVADGFNTETDPYGRTWLPSRSPNTLRDRGALKNSFSRQTTPDGFAIGTNLIYAASHQYGAVIKAKNGPYLKFKVPHLNRIRGKRGKLLKRPKTGFQWIQVKQVKIPQRQMVPEGQLGIRWTIRFTRVSRDLVNNHMKGTG